MIDKIALLLVIVGGINWGLVGIFQFDLVACIFGGQTAIKLTKFLSDNGVNILGTSADSIDMAEDRERFDELLEKHNIPGGCATSFKRGRFEFEPSLHELCSVGNPEHPDKVYTLFEELGAKPEWCYETGNVFL